MPFKAVISTEQEILQERFFLSRAEAETFIVDTLKELRQTDREGRSR